MAMMRNKSFLIVFQLVLALEHPFNAEPIPYSEQTKLGCSTPGCKKAAQYITDAIDSQADPCKDFYAYACGGWEKKHEIPSSKTRIGSFDLLNDKMVDEIKHVLNLVDSNHYETNQSSSVLAAKHLYDSCIKSGHSLKQISELIHLNEGWTIGSNNDRPWYELWVKGVSTAQVHPIFKIYVSPNPKNVTQNLITLETATFAIGDLELQKPESNAEIIESYKKFLTGLGKMFCKNDCPLLEKDVQSIVDLEISLAKHKLSHEALRNPNNWNNQVTVSKLNQLTGFDWLNKVLNPLLAEMKVSYRLKENDTILVTDLYYFGNASKILSSLPSRVMVNYLGMSIVEEYGAYSSEAVRQKEFEFTKIKTGIKHMTERPRLCYNLVYRQFPYTLSRLFIDRYFTKQEYNNASTLINEIQSSFEEMVKENQWLNDAARKASSQKLSKVRKNVAYPTWLLDDKKLNQFNGLDDELFAQEFMKRENFLLSLILLSQKLYRNNLEEKLKSFDPEKNWPMPPAIVNAAYEPTQNSITIPAGILDLPFFASDRPPVMNYGGIGVVIGHEFTHGLDDEGRQFDEQGNLKNWWTTETVENFTKHAQCFVKQYSSQKEPLTGLFLNGQNTLGENIADNGGIREAFQAFRNFQKRFPSLEQTLADLPNLKAEQLFFISYAHSWCSKTRKESLKLLIEYNPHSPERFRVNIPVANSEEFSKAFKCAAETPMNPAKRCVVW